LIDLHTHTTASDGRCTPSELVTRAALAGLRVLSVTDHDTVGGCEEAAAACGVAHIEFVPGIEITAIREAVDVHTLGYFVDVGSRALQTFLDAQRLHRIKRLRVIVERLGGLGIGLDAEAILQPAIADPSKSVGRPWIARAMVASGHAATVGEAFDRWLGYGRPAFAPRVGAPPEEVITRIHEAGGLASVAHPGLLEHDEWLPSLVDAGLDAIEAYHSEHTGEMTARYLSLAAELGVAVSGGSDYHADDVHGGTSLGEVSLPKQAYARLVALAGRRSGMS
jgi:predicted metal-dependent phosphoesterase TrpH